MLKWLRLTLFRAGITLVAGLLIALIFLWLPYRFDHRIIPQQLSYWNKQPTKVQQSLKIIKSLPDLSRVQLQQIGVISDYQRNLANSSSSCRKLTLNPSPTPRVLPGLHIGKDGKEIQAVEQSVAVTRKLKLTDVINDQKSACQLISYQATITKDLVNILEYNPVVDSQNFDLKSADTQKRLSLAKQGLAKAYQALQNDQDLSDASIGSVMAAISGIQAAQNQLAKDGNTATWANLVNKEQVIIQANRALFWQNSAKTVLANLQTDATQLTKIQQQWQSTANSFSTN